MQNQIFYFMKSSLNWPFVYSSITMREPKSHPSHVFVLILTSISERFWEAELDTWLRARSSRSLLINIQIVLLRWGRLRDFYNVSWMLINRVAIHIFEILKHHRILLWGLFIRGRWRFGGRWRFYLWTPWRSWWGQWCFRAQWRFGAPFYTCKIDLKLSSKFAA